MKKWNYDKQVYELYNTGPGWDVALYKMDLTEKINCASCGKEIEFGAGYTSREIHTEFGLGYSVCDECSKEEFKRDWDYRYKIKE